MTKCGCQKKVRKKMGFFEKPLFDFNEDGNVKAECVVTDEDNGILEIS